VSRYINVEKYTVALPLTRYVLVYNQEIVTTEPLPSLELSISIPSTTLNRSLSLSFSLVLSLYTLHYLSLHGLIFTLARVTFLIFCLIFSATSLKWKSLL